MKKILCTEMYKATINVMLNDTGYTKLDLGYFEHKKDAIILCNLVTKILNKEKSHLETRWVDNSKIEQVFVPETKLSQISYYDSYISATKKDSFVEFYRKKNGKEALTNLILETLAEVNIEQHIQCNSTQELIK